MRIAQLGLMAVGVLVLAGGAGTGAFAADVDVQDGLPAWANRAIDEAVARYKAWT